MYAQAPFFSLLLFSLFLKKTLLCSNFYMPSQTSPNYSFFFLLKKIYIYTYNIYVCILYSYTNFLPSSSSSFFLYYQIKNDTIEQNFVWSNRKKICVVP